mmetsp:Transcript_73286/g.164076  ORF Transcript_73286/g.164076 Transcript_73286/m.164076 type:complete len:138 (-) Transcript_73286:61-474(-)
MARPLVLVTLCLAAQACAAAAEDAAVAAGSHGAVSNRSDSLSTGHNHSVAVKRPGANLRGRADWTAGANETPPHDTEKAQAVPEVGAAWAGSACTSMCRRWCGGRAGSSLCSWGSCYCSCGSSRKRAIGSCPTSGLY